MSKTPSTPKLKKIKALFGLDKMTDGNITPLLDASSKGLTTNATVFPKPPVDLTAYQAAITAYEASIAAAVDGGKTAISQKKKLRHAVLKIYSELAHYVEANCNDDMTTFRLSGFQPAATTKTPPQPLPVPAIASVVQGPNSGQLKVKIAPVAKALSYDVRFAPLPAGGATPASWTVQTLPSKKAAIVSNLTPGTTYTLQARALGRLGYTDWSDPANRMVT